ncbi:MAG TPA: serine hydrolase domain-containing protein [Flavobacterium sp.]|nr:serine hydrolase domain-containing protein [Flavobacterium sp.]
MIRKSNFIHAGIVGLLFLLPTSCAKDAQAQTNHQLFEKKSFEVPCTRLTPEYLIEKKAIIDTYFHTHIDKGNFSGGFLVAKNGQIIYEDYQGYSNYEEKKEINKNTPIHVASVGKTLTSTSILRLVNAGKIQLDQKVNTILPEFPYENITVRMLLNHRSGIPYYGYFTEKKGVWDRTKTIHNNDVLELLGSKNIKLGFTPDTRFQYSNTNYVILASIVEKITGKSFQMALRELILNPLEMNHTFVMDDLSKKEKVTQSYYANHKRMHWNYLDGTYGDKNIYTTPRDMMKFDLAMYSDDFLSKELKAEMFKGYSYERPGQNNYGLGFRLIEPKNEGDLYSYHNGWWRGNRTSYITIRQDTVAIICFANNNSTDAYNTKDLAKEFGNFPFL